MSRGLGIWQRYILAALERQPALILRDLLPPSHTRAQYVALDRAARTLWEKGKVDIIHGQLRSAVNTAWIVRPGYRCDRNQVPRISVDAIPNLNGINTYRSGRKDRP
jgi:hypothetical protein